jgi:UDP-N-acetylglucosamine 2-epimerase (non-hydrolysing)
MKPNQTLSELSANTLIGLKSVIEEVRPDIIFVQGDTTTAFIGGLSAFYHKIKVAHLEAGLRSGDKYSPFPEEVNRKLLSNVSDFHFAPTKLAKESLNREGVLDSVWVVGNTVVDALLIGIESLEINNLDFYSEFSYLDFSKPIILLTAHRRESFGEPFSNICDAIIDIRDSFKDVQFLYPVHPNPNVREIVEKQLEGEERIFLTSPLDYKRLIWLMKKSYVVLTDSGGIQEEAPALGKPVLVLRDVTERQEGIIAGTAKLVGTRRELIVEEMGNLITNKDKIYTKMAKAVNPYGDGTTSHQILEILKKHV